MTRPLADVLGAERALPIHEAHRVRMSAIVLERVRHRISPEEYRKARKRIESAAKRHDGVLPPSREHADS